MLKEKIKGIKKMETLNKILISLTNAHQKFKLRINSKKTKIFMVENIDIKIGKS